MSQRPRFTRHTAHVTDDPGAYDDPTDTIRGVGHKTGHISLQQLRELVTRTADWPAESHIDLDTTGRDDAIVVARPEPERTQARMTAPAPAPLVFLDTETTELDPDDRRPWEIAMIRRPAMNGEDRITLLVSDVDLSRANERSLKVGRFDERHMRLEDIAFHQPPPRQTMVVTEATAARIVYDWTRGAYLIGIVPDFDAWTLDRMLRRHGLFPRWNHRLICARTLAVGWLHGLAAHGHSSLACSETPNCDRDQMPIGMPWDSEAITKALGVEPPTEDELHTAMGDTLWAQRLFDRVCSDHDERPA